MLAVKQDAMTKLVILGTANVIPDVAHENTHMVVTGPSGSVLIDCGTSPIVSLQRAGVDIDHLLALIVTHFHPDHVSGVPMLLLNLWLMGRKQPIKIHGLRLVMGKVQAMMNLFDYSNWPEFFPVEYETVDAVPGARVLESPDLRIFAAPTRHLVPSIAVRVISQASGRSVVYSSDTSPCDTLVQLARGADVLLHEASGAASGHSSAAMAGSIARQAGVGHLALIHYDVKGDSDGLIAEAHYTFDGRVTVTHDLEEFEF
jgi:ribonuclease Z